MSTTRFSQYQANRKLGPLPDAVPIAPLVTEEKPPVQQELPKVDTSDAINSLAGLLVTPEQRKQQELALMKQKRNMAAWTGLFDGLRNIGNLYYTTRGATPQQYTDNLYQQNEKEYQNARAISDDLLKRQDNYARQMVALKQQAEEASRKNMVAEAQANHYNYTKPVVVSGTNGAKYILNPFTNQLEQVLGQDPKAVEEQESRIKKNINQGRAAVSNAAANNKRANNTGKTNGSGKTNTGSSNNTTGSLLPKNK